MKKIKYNNQWYKIVFIDDFIVLTPLTPLTPKNKGIKLANEAQKSQKSPQSSPVDKAPLKTQDKTFQENKPLNAPKNAKLTLKDKLYGQALIKHKGNQCKAYEEVYPNHNNHATRKTQDLMAKNGEFLKENTITTDWILDKLKEHALNCKKGSDRIRSLELLGKWKAMFTDKTHITGQIHTEAEETEYNDIVNRINHN